LKWITCPRLTSLSLSNFVWDDVRTDFQAVVTQVEDFIVRHGKTLKKLELHDCTICVPPPLGDGTGPTPVRSWAAVWNRFADELTELVDLVVVYNSHRRYVYFLRVQEFGRFDSYSAFLPGIEEDTPALEALVTIVKGRKRLNSRDGD